MLQQHTGTFEGRANHVPTLIILPMICLTSRDKLGEGDGCRDALEHPLASKVVHQRDSTFAVDRQYLA